MFSFAVAIMARAKAPSALALATLLALSCGSEPVSGTSNTFSVAAEQIMTSAHGLLHIEIHNAPPELVRGTNKFRLKITDASGTTIDGLALAVTPWMPAHGHGTSVVPSVSARGQGEYEIDEVYLFMAGQWELRIVFSGTESDSAIPTFDIP